MAGLCCDPRCSATCGCTESALCALTTSGQVTFRPNMMLSKRIQMLPQMILGRKCNDHGMGLSQGGQSTGGRCRRPPCCHSAPRSRYTAVRSAVFTTHTFAAPKGSRFIDLPSVCVDGKSPKLHCCHRPPRQRIFE